MLLNPGLQNQVETAAAGWRSDVLWLEPLRIFLSSESRAGLRPFGLWRRAGTFPLWLMKRPIHQPGPETFPPDREADAAPDGGLKGTRCSPRRPLFKSTQTRFSFSTVTNVQAAWRKLCVCACVCLTISFLTCLVLCLFCVFYHYSSQSWFWDFWETTVGKNMY